MVEMSQLRQAYKIARQNKRRSADCVRFDLYAERNLARLARDIENRSLAPSAYTFVTMKPRPREVFACDMATRVLHHYLDLRMRPLIERRLSDRTFNNRVGFGQDAAVNTVISDIYEATAGFTRDAWIVTMDLQGYFPNANQDTAYAQLSCVIVEDYEGPDKDDLLFILQRTIYSYPTRHCFRKSPVWKWRAYIAPEKSLFSKPDGIGAAIGHLLWQNGMNYYLNDLDHWVLNNITSHYVRFVDDMYFVVQNKEAFLAYVMPEIRRRLEAHDCCLHPRKFYCQHYTKGVNLLGNTVKMGRVYPSRRIVRRARLAVVNFNRCPRPGKVEAFISTINSYFGIFKRRNAYGIIRDTVDAIAPAWFEFIHYDDQRRTITANPGYGHHALIATKYKLKYKYENGNARNTTERTAIA